MNEPTIELTPYLSYTKIKQLANENGLSCGEIKDCLTKNNPKQCIEEKIISKKKKEIEEEELRKKKEIEEEFDFGISR